MDACEECVSLRTALAAEFRALQPLFTALGDETRQRVLLALLECREMGLRTGELAERTHLSRPAVTRHLRVLRAAGAVEACRDGRRTYYYADASAQGWSDLRLMAEHICAVTRTAAQEGYPHFDV